MPRRGETHAKRQLLIPFEIRLRALVALACLSHWRQQDESPDTDVRLPTGAVPALSPEVTGFDVAKVLCITRTEIGSAIGTAEQRFRSDREL